jgi:hypothetical protein
MKLTSLSSNIKNTLSHISYGSNGLFKKYKINNHKFMNSVENKKCKNSNSLITKIHNNSDFMKNKKFYCVSPKEKTSTKGPNIFNKKNKNKIMPSIRYYNNTMHTFISRTIFPNNSYNSYNFTNNLIVLKTNSLSNDKRFFKDFNNY